MNKLLRLDFESLPRSVAWDKPVSDRQFDALCAANDVILFERTKEGVIVMNPPTGGYTGNANAEISRQLGNWWISHKQGKVYDSSTGFSLPDGSILSPDASYVLPRKAKRKQQGFLRLCPDFVIELLSKSDSLSETQAKMNDWIANGAALAWLINPYKKRVSVYRPGTETITVGGRSIQGSGPVDGFALDLAEVWRCYE